MTVEVTSAGDAVEEVEEKIIVPVDATFTGNEAPEPEAQPEAPAAPEEPEAEEPEEEPEIGGEFIHDVLQSMPSFWGSGPTSYLWGMGFRSLPNITVSFCELFGELT